MPFAPTLRTCSATIYNDPCGDRERKRPDLCHKDQGSSICTVNLEAVAKDVFIQFYKASDEIYRPRLKAFKNAWRRSVCSFGLAGTHVIKRIPRRVRPWMQLHRRTMQATFRWHFVCIDFFSTWIISTM